MNTQLFLNSYGSVILWFVVFALFHSVGAQDALKAALARRLSPFFMEYFWRLAYSLVSWILLYPIFFRQFYAVDPRFFQPLCIFPDWLRASIDVLRAGGILLCYWAFLQFDYLSFIGIRQFLQGIRLLRGRQAASVPISVAGVNRLEVKGIYKYIRHPMMTGSFLLVLPSWISVSSLMVLAFFVAYILVGNYFEDQRLIQTFGSEYLDYKKSVGAYFPRLRLSGLKVIENGLSRLF